MKEKKRYELAELISAVLKDEVDQPELLLKQLEEVLTPYDQIIMCSSAEANVGPKKVS